MAHPMTHAESSVRRFGGTPEDYIEIHDFMDSSKAAFPDNRHRALTHNSWFIFVCEKVFGHYIEIKVEKPCSNCHGRPNKASFGVDASNQDEFMDTFCVCGGGGIEHDKKKVYVRYICEQHILEDFGGKYIPTPADYLEGMEFQEWMNNGIKGAPTSHRKLANRDRKTTRRAVTLD